MQFRLGAARLLFPKERGETDEREDMGMKRILAALLVLTMMFVLIACGADKSGSGSNQAVSQANEKNQKNPAQGTAHVDELSVEDVSLEYAEKQNCYMISAKVRNNQYPTVEGWPTVTMVSVHFRFLDAAGDGLPSNCDAINNMDTLPGLAPGAASWAGGFKVDVGVVDTAESIVFDSYRILYQGEDKSYAENINGVFSDPPVFHLDDIIPGRANAKATAESDAVTVENVSVDFVDTLPMEIKGETAYMAGVKKDFNYTLNDSETYAVIEFSITNMTTREMTLADIGGNFYVDLRFDEGFVYSTKGSKACLMKSGKEFAVMGRSGSKSTRIGDPIALSPLVTYDVTLYLPCAKLVSTQTDKPLVVSFHTTQTGDKQVDVKVR